MLSAESVQEITALIVFAKLQPSHMLVCTCKQLCKDVNVKKKKWGCCVLVLLGTRGEEKVKGRRERKEGGRGGGFLKNAGCVAVATRKTTRGSPWPRPPPPHSLLLLLLLVSIYFTKWCHVPLIYLSVCHKQFFRLIVFLFKGRNVVEFLWRLVFCF